jgi:hypothetical protein
MKALGFQPALRGSAESSQAALDVFMSMGIKFAYISPTSNGTSSSASTTYATSQSAHCSLLEDTNTLTCCFVRVEPKIIMGMGFILRFVSTIFLALNPVRIPFDERNHWFLQQMLW